MDKSYNIPDYAGEVIFGIITKSGKIRTIQGPNSKTHIELFGINKITGCDRFRVIDDDIYITYRATRTRDTINDILSESFPGKKVKKYQVMVTNILAKKRRDMIEKTCREKGVGQYLAGVISEVHSGD